MLFNRHKAATPPPASEPAVEPLVTPTETPSTPPPAAEFVPKQEFDELKASIFELRDNVTNYFMKQNQPATQAASPQPIQIEDVTDEEYEDAIAGNITDKRKAAAIVRKRHQADNTRANLTLHQEIAQLKQIGTTSIGNLTVQTLQGKPHYTAYKKEIDAAVAQLPPEGRMNHEALDWIYRSVVGAHIDEILAKERETTLRQAAATPAATPPTGRSTLGGKASTSPDPREALDPSALDAIRYKYGRVDDLSITQFVRSQGEKDWDSYYNHFIKPLEETTGNA